MSFQYQPGSGSLFTNDKEGNDKRPDYRGDINIDGKNYRIAGWIKEGKKGAFISLKVDDKAAPDMASRVDSKPAQQRDHKPSTPPVPSVDDGFGDSDIPF